MGLTGHEPVRGGTLGSFIEANKITDVQSSSDEGSDATPQAQLPQDLSEASKNFARYDARNGGSVSEQSKWDDLFRAILAEKVPGHRASRILRGCLEAVEPAHSFDGEAAVRRAGVSTHPIPSRHLPFECPSSRGRQGGQVSGVDGEASAGGKRVFGFRACVVQASIREDRAEPAHAQRGRRRSGVARAQAADVGPVRGSFACRLSQAAAGNDDEIVDTTLNDGANTSLAASQTMNVDENLTTEPTILRTGSKWRKSGSERARSQDRRIPTGSDDDVWQMRRTRRTGGLVGRSGVTCG